MFFFLSIIFFFANIFISEETAHLKHENLIFQHNCHKSTCEDNLNLENLFVRFKYFFWLQESFNFI